MRRFMILLAATAALVCAQAAQPPAGYASVNISGMATTIPTLETALKNWTDTVEHTSILSLVNEGLVTPNAVAGEALATANVFCAEAQGLAPGCADVQGVAAPFIAELKLVFSIVPASQWDPQKFSANLPVYAAAYVSAAVAAPPPPAKPMVGACYSVGASTPICYAAPGITLAQVQDGNIVNDAAGKRYVAHITQGLIGPSLWFTPVQ